MYAALSQGRPLLRGVEKKPSFVFDSIDGARVVSTETLAKSVGPHHSAIERDLDAHHEVGKDLDVHHGIGKLVGKRNAGCLCPHFVSSALVSHRRAMGSVMENSSRGRVDADDPMGRGPEGVRLVPDSRSPLDWPHPLHSEKGWKELAFSRTLYQLNRERVEAH